VEAGDGIVRPPQAETLAQLGPEAARFLGVGSGPQAEGRETIEGVGGLARHPDDERHAEKSSTF
jgi:hypothetical protein